MPIFAARAARRIAVRAYKIVTQVRRSHPSHEAPPCLAISKRSAAPFSLLSRPPSAPRLRRVERHKGHAKRLFDFLDMKVAWMAVEKAKVRQAVKRHDVLPPGVVLLFSRFYQSTGQQYV